MICLECDNEEFVEMESEIPQEFKGESLKVLAPVMVCCRCGWYSVANGKIDLLIERTKEAYRKKMSETA